MAAAGGMAGKFLFKAISPDLGALMAATFPSEGLPVGSGRETGQTLCGILCLPGQMLESARLPGVPSWPIRVQVGLRQNEAAPVKSAGRHVGINPQALVASTVEFRHHFQQAPTRHKGPCGIVGFGQADQIEGLVFEGPHWLSVFWLFGHSPWTEVER